MDSLNSGGSPVIPPEAARFALEWNFWPTVELPGGHCSRVFADATRVLKVPFQGEETTTGALAAQRLQEAGGPKVLALDRASGMVLMERLSPGGTLERFGLDPMTVDVFIDLAQRMRSLPSDSLMGVEAYVGKPSALLKQLMETTTGSCFLHGDLHHVNILWDGSAWRPIDPKGLLGDPHYELIAFLRNPLDVLNSTEELLELTRRRLLELCGRMGLDPWRVAAWGLVDHGEANEPVSGELSAWDRLPGVYAQLEAELRS